MSARRATEDPTILVIDDDEDVLNLAVEGLTRFGHSVIGSSNPQQALQLISTMSSLRLLLSDVDLGSTTGPALIREAMRNRPPGLGVVFMSGDFGEARIRSTDTMIHKPLSLTQLHTVVEDALHSAPTPFIPRDDGVERRRSVT